MRLAAIDRDLGQMQDSSTRSRIRHTSQGDAAAANAAGGILMMEQGILRFLFFLLCAKRKLKKDILSWLHPWPPGLANKQK